jgi:hypothetical protein
MKKYQLSALMALAITCATGFTACSSNDIGEDEKNVVIDEKYVASVTFEAEKADGEVEHREDAQHEADIIIAPDPEREGDPVQSAIRGI